MRTNFSFQNTIRTYNQNKTKKMYRKQPGIILPVEFENKRMHLVVDAQKHYLVEGVVNLNK